MSAPTLDLRRQGAPGAEVTGDRPDSRSRAADEFGGAGVRVTRESHSHLLLRSDAISLCGVMCPARQSRRLTG